MDVLSPIACIALVPVLPALHASSPNIQLYLGATDRVVDSIDENVDCVVCRGEITNLPLVARHTADLTLVTARIFHKSRPVQ